MNKRLTPLALALALVLFSTPLLADDLLTISQYALEQDPQLEISQLDIQIQQEQTVQAAAALLPALSGSLQYDYGDNSRYTDQNRGVHYSLTLAQSLYNRSSQKRLKQAEIATHEKQLQLELDRQQLLLRVANTYFEQLAASEAVTLAEQELNATAQQLKQVRKQFEVGTASMTDLQEVQARYDLNHARQVSVRAALSNSRERLLELINRDFTPLQPLQQQIPLDTPSPQQPEAWVELALENSIALKQLEQQRQAATTAIEAALAGYYPTIELVGSVARNENSNPLYGGDNDSYSLGLQASVPLINGGATRSKVAQARQQRQQITARVEQLRRSTVKQVRSSYLAVTTAIELVKAEQQVVTSAKTALKATRSGVQVGTRTTADLLDAQSELFSARRQLSQARYDLLLARLTLKQVVGSLTLEDIESINQLLQHTG